MRHKTGVHENETRFLDFFFFKSSMMNVTRFRVQGRKDEEVRGDEPKNGV